MRKQYNWDSTESKVILNDFDRHVIVWGIGSGNELKVVVMNLSSDELDVDALMWRIVFIPRITFPIPEPFSKKTIWNYSLNTDDPSFDPYNSVETDPVNIVECTPEASSKWDMLMGYEE